ncbi:MAG: Asparagine synthetase (glutamine-hydrolyzing) 1 [Actinobacteria bacterium]|nr:Asparagine synthetase (glutamine-hydrolyzing) 1 [Actinomycetota bacterium]
MCGICGAYGLRDLSIVRRMCHVMVHRGPDDEGYYLFPKSSPPESKKDVRPGITKESPMHRGAPRRMKIGLFSRENVGLLTSWSPGSLSFGHRRLAIIDLSQAGHQPMSNEEGSVWVVHNGEIYNFPELRKRLEQKGHRFRSNTDTEVIIHSYEEWGEECLQEFRGMFAFALWDEKKEKLFLARDRLGIKPLYYAQVNDQFLFASELKAILASGLVKKQLDPQGLHYFLSFYSVPSPFTLIQGVRSLPAGHKILVSQNGVRIIPYWDVSFGNKSDVARMDEAEIKLELRRLLEEAVRIRLISDVPLGAFLSGGVDSSAIVGLMSRMSSLPVKTFSVGFGEEGADIDELRYARIIADRFSTDHTEVIVSGKDVLEDLDRIIYGMDQPSGDGINSYFVSKAARKRITVALSGLGGDELFAGYLHFRLLSKIYSFEERFPGMAKKFLVNFYRRAPSKIRERYPINLMGYLGKSFVDKYARVRSLFTEEEKEKIYSAAYLQANRDLMRPEQFLSSLTDNNVQNLIEKISRLELKNYMAHTLLRDMDVMSMIHSLEVRVPLLDYKLVEFACHIPSHLKLQGSTAKYIFLESLRDLLPEEIVNRKKMGFELPMASWLEKELKPIVEDVFSPRSVKKRGIFDPDQLERVYSDFKKGRAGYLKVWVFVVLELWMRRFLDNPGGLINP